MNLTCGSQNTDIRHTDKSNKKNSDDKVFGFTESNGKICR